MIKTSKKTKGFSLIETIVVVAIFGLIVSSASLVFNGTRNKVALESAQASLVSSLQEARNRAASGVGETGTNHGIYLDQASDKIIFFEVDSSGSETVNKEISLPPNISVVGESLEIIFDRLSGKTDEKTIELKNNITQETVEIEVK